MNKILYIAALILSISLVSCEDFFELNPHDSTAADDIMTSEKDAQIMLNGMYARYMSSSSYGRYLTVLTDIMTDAALATSGFTNQMGYMYAWNIQPGVSEITAVWANHYGGLYNTNFIIDNIDGLEGDSINLNRIKGEALVGRALMHYNLVRLYGKAYNSTSASSDPGIPYISTNDVGSPARNSVEEVYSFMIEDLTEALSLLPTEPSADNVFFTSHFANGLLARISLEMKNYTDALTYSTAVIENSGCKLLEGDDFKNMWLKDVGDEIIWKVGYTETDLGAAPGYNFGNRNNEETLRQPDYIAANWVLDLYDPVEDIRFQTYYIYTSTGFGWDGYLINKYPTNPTLPFTQGLNMPKPMRLAEMYLIRAEANAYLDKEDDARTDLETLINSRRENDYIVTESGDALKSYIMDERVRELIFEGLYFHDLKRAGLGFERVPQENTSAANDLKIAGDDYRWQWPIPTAEINGNDNIEQNPGY